MVVRSFRAALLAGALLVGQVIPAQAGPSTSPGAGASTTVTQVYPAADLVVPAGGGKSAEDKLIEIIQSTVCPLSWATTGSTGTIQYHPLTHALVVNQAPA